VKKILVAILAFVYITTSTGAAIRMHYCMGQLSEWGVGSDDSKICGTCGMQESNEKDNGCCKDKHLVVKNNIDQKFTETGFTTQVLSAALPAGFIEVKSNDLSSVADENPGSHAPPRNKGVAVYIRNRVFLI